MEPRRVSKFCQLPSGRSESIDIAVVTHWKFKTITFITQTPGIQVYSPMSVLAIGNPLDDSTQPFPPLYAPVPLQSTAPLLDAQSDFDVCASDYSTPELRESDEDKGMNSSCEPQDPHLGEANYVNLDFQPTFPTPSELLSQEDDFQDSSPEALSDHRLHVGLRASPKADRKHRRRVTGPSTAPVPLDPDP